MMLLVLVLARMAPGASAHPPPLAEGHLKFMSSYGMNATAMRGWVNVACGGGAGAPSVDPAGSVGSPPWWELYDDYDMYVMPRLDELVDRSLPGKAGSLRSLLAARNRSAWEPLVTAWARRQSTRAVLSFSTRVSGFPIGISGM
jgi:hypothetical protein